MENKFSNAGYHNKFAIKYGEIELSIKDSFNKIKPSKKLRPYTAPSPRKFFPKKLRNKKINNAIIKIINSLFIYLIFRDSINKIVKIDIINKFNGHKQLVPSIKLNPLIKTMKKNVHNKILVKL
tara:strand:- start:200 stop:571 length:372 start_codon:yes stop_codon:yes gene_type:complete